MKPYLSLTILASFVFITACGKPPAGSKKTATITPEQITQLLERQKFECESLGGRCPEGIARVFILDLADPLKTGLCTGFLTKSNRLVTNHHCLSTQRQCDSTYLSIYNGYSYEVAKCRGIISSQDDGKPLAQKALDYTVMELDRHIRNSDVFSIGDSARVGDVLTAWVVDHVDLFTGRITELSCKLVSWPGSLELDGCPIILGNSGSPLVNGEGKVVGVIWGATAGTEVNESTPLVLRRQIDTKGYATDVDFFKDKLSQIGPDVD